MVERGVKYNKYKVMEYGSKVREREIESGES